MTDTDTQIFLSAEEQAALAEPDDAAPAAEATDDADIAAQDDSSSDEAYAPLLVAKEIPQAGAALRALDDHEADLQTKFDEGEITSSELASGLREVQSHRNEITWALRKNELAVEMQQTHEDEKWNRAVRGFMSTEGAAIKNSDIHKQMFDTHVRKITADPTNVGLSYAGQLRKAWGVYRKELDAAGFGGTLDGGNTIASGGSSNFAALDRLADSNPAKFEKAFAALSADEQSAYLES